MIGAKVATSAMIMSAAQLLARLLDFAGIVILARILTPADFGLVTLASSVLLIANSVTELPVSDALVQRERLERSAVDSAFTLTLLRGLLMAVGLVLLAPFLARLFDEPRLELVIQVFAIGPLIQGIASPMIAASLREVNYVPLAKAQLVGKFVAFIVTVTLALIFRNYWALVAGFVISPAATAIATYVMAPYRPRIGFAGAGSLFNFAGWMTLARTISTINTQADRFFVGTLLGKPQLGHYAMAGDLASMATQTVAAPLMQPLFAGFSRLRSDPIRMADAYLKGQQIMVALLLPLGFGFAAVAHPFVKLALGNQWLAIVPLIWWLAPSTALQMLTVPVQALCTALGKPKLIAVREAIWLLVRFPLTIFMVWQYGLVAAAAARSIAAILLISMNLLLVRSLLGIGIFRQLIANGRSLAAVIAMTAAVIGFGQLLPTASGVPLQLLCFAALLGLGGSVYCAALFLLWKLAGKPTGAEEWFVSEALRLRGNWAGRPAAKSVSGG